MNKLITNLKYALSAALIKTDWTRLRKADLLLTCHDADRGYQHNGKAYSPMIDSIADIAITMGVTVNAVAIPFSQLCNDRACNQPVVLNRPFLRLTIASRMAKLILGNDRGERWVAEKKAALWQRVLERTQPRLVIGVQPDSFLCRACRRLGIPVYDMQHGVIAHDHRWYSDTLKNHTPVEQLPSGFLCWDHQSADVLAWARTRDSSACVVGNPWFERFLYPSAADSLVQQALRQGKIFDNANPTILVTLQWGLEEFYADDSDFNKLMGKALQQAIEHTHAKYNWLLRLHPVQLRGTDAAYCQEKLSTDFAHCKNVEWSRASAQPLPVILAQSHLHITDCSTVVVEAAWMGICSALLNPHLNEGGKLQSYYLNERRIGAATVIPQDARAIEAWIEQHLQPDATKPQIALRQQGMQDWLTTAIARNKPARM